MTEIIILIYFANIQSTMKRILYPVDQGKLSIGDDNVKRMNKKTTTKWESLDPLEMATKLAVMAREEDDTKTSSLTLLERRSLPPLRIDTTFLSSETPNVPPMPDHIRNMTVENHDITESSYLKSSMTTHSTTRSMRSKGEDGPWDPSFLLKHNPDQLAARTAVQHLSTLARQFESMECFEEYLSSYERVKTHLLDKSNFIYKSKSSRHEKSKCFEKLYSSVIDQMSALITMTKNASGDRENHFLDENRLTMPRTDRNEINVVSGEYSKKDFTEFMNNWLKENWTNPYPDDDGLAEIAAMNGTSPTIVSNWLINARTRKWRPAIVKAYETGRAADMLKDDSINIFDGKPVRTERVNIVQP